MARRRRQKRRKRRSIWSVIFPLLLIILLVFLGAIAYWVLSGQDVSVGRLPLPAVQDILGGNTQEETTGGQTVSSEDAAEEIAQLAEQYEAGRIDYGGVKRGLARISTEALGESEMEAYQSLSAQAEQDFRDAVAGYISGGNYSEASALLSRMRATLPDDEVTQSLISQYQAELGL